jgi:hypothetical protein
MGYADQIPRGLASVPADAGLNSFDQQIDQGWFFPTSKYPNIPYSGDAYFFLDKTFLATTNFH